MTMMMIWMEILEEKNDSEDESKVIAAVVVVDASDEE